MNKGLKLASILSLAIALFYCKKPSSISDAADQIITEVSEVIKPNTSPEGYPIVTLPANADTNMAYWKGVDLAPKPPVLPLTVAEEQAKFVLMDGYKMEPVLSEPQIQQPGQIAFDGNGRMYVLELRSYMLTADSDGTLEPISGISRWEDKDNDGVYETGGMFVDKLIFPRFVLPYGKDCILTMESNKDIVYKYTDTDGDGKADKREFFCDGYGRSGNVEHQQASMYWGMDNWLYSTVNPFRVREIDGVVQRENTASNNGQWGISHDDDGKLWFQGGSSGLPAYFQFPVHYGDYQVKDVNFEKGFEEPWGSPILLGDMQAGMGAIRQPDGSLNRVTGAAGNDIYRGDRLPKELYGQLFYGEPVARIVRRVAQTKNEGITTLSNVYQNEHAEFIRSTDPLFRPVDMTTAPDGSMYITDMYHGIIQEGQWAGKGSYLRVKIEQYQLDKVIGLGRIWRLSHQSKERSKTQPKMLDETAEQLVKHLENPNGWWRDMAQQLLVLKNDKSIVASLEKMAKSHFQLEPRFHALWVLEGMGSLDAQLVKSLLKDPSYRMRMMAMYVSETLYKKGDKSFGEDYLRLMHDANTEVAMRAMMTAKMLLVPDHQEEVKIVKAENKAAGVQLIAEQVLNPPVVHSFFGRSNPNHSDEQKELIAKGEKIYKELCSACHGVDGRGTPSGDALMAPSFVGNKRVKGHSDYVLKTLLSGLTGPIEGKSYEGVIMVPMGADQDDEWVASVASFIRYAFDNEAATVDPKEVAKVRAETAKQKEPYQYSYLKSIVPQEINYNENWTISSSHAIPIRKGGTGLAAGAFTFEGWTTGEPQKPDMWFLTEMNSANTISEIQFKSIDIQQGNFRERLPSLKTNPKYLIVETSLDGKAWKTVWEGETPRSPNVLRFEPTRAKYVRFKQMGTESKAPWTMESLRFYGQMTDV